MFINVVLLNNKTQVHNKNNKQSEEVFTNIPKVLIITQARLNSSRLPGKVLRPFASGECILDRLVREFEKVNIPHVVATTNSSDDDELVFFLEKKGVKYFRGSESNVLKRFLDCTTDFQSISHIIRVCADNPFLQSHHLNKYLSVLKNDHQLDYLCYADSDGLPCIKTHWGIYGELVSVVALKNILKDTTEEYHLEHVTSYIYNNMNMFNTLLLDAPDIIKNRKDLRFTVDNMDDFEIADQLISKVGHDFSIRTLIEEVDNNEFVHNRMKNNIAKYHK